MINTKLIAVSSQHPMTRCYIGLRLRPVVYACVENRLASILEGRFNGRVYNFLWRRVQTLIGREARRRVYNLFVPV